MIDPLFGYVKLNDAGREKATNIARYFTNLLEEIESIIPKGRELSIVRTKLEEASFYAKKSLVNDEANYRGVETKKELLYIIEYKCNGKSKGRSYNESYTRPTLNNVEFQDRAEAEKEATLQQNAMGLSYTYTVAVKE